MIPITLLPKILHKKLLGTQTQVNATCGSSGPAQS